MSQLPKIHKTLAEIAALVKGELLGDASAIIEGAATLEEAGDKEVSFLGNPKYGATAARSKAECLFLLPNAKDFSCAAKNRIYVEDPQLAFSLVLGLIEALSPPPPPSLSPKADIHYKALLGKNVSVGAFAVIEEGVAIAEGVRIGAHVTLGENVRIGRNCVIRPSVTILHGCVLGERVVIHSGTVIGGDGYGFTTDPKTGRHRKIPQLGNVVIEDDVEIGSNVSIDRGTVGSTRIGAGTKIDNLVQLGHNTALGRDCLIVSQVGISGSCHLGDRVILAGQVGLAGHLNIGEGAIVMAKSGIMADIEKGQILFGYPARPHRESLKLLALYGKLPEIYEAIKQVKKKLGLTPDKTARREVGK